MKPQTIFDKIWNSHIVRPNDGLANVSYMTDILVHEVTSPQAFEGLRNKIEK